MSPTPVAIRVRHNFETAHRLPQLGGKCTSLHGHSWWAEWEITGADVDDKGVVVDFGSIKAGLRDWVDFHLDHGAMLAAGDPLVPPLVEASSKVFRFGVIDHTARPGEVFAEMLPYPTVEAVAELLHGVATALVRDRVRPGQRLAVTGVVVTEKHDNAAVYPAPHIPAGW